MCADTRSRRVPLKPPETEHEVKMKENRTVARWFAGLLMVSTVVVGGVAPAQASDSGWNGTVAPPTDTTTTTTTTPTTPYTKTLPSFLKDSGWNGT
jgi:hypothetical protein